MDDATRAERNRLKETYPDEYEAGVLRGLGETTGYPKGFHKWPLDRRNAWWAGFNVGYIVHNGPPQDDEAANG